MKNKKRIVFLILYAYILLSFIAFVGCDNPSGLRPVSGKVLVPERSDFNFEKISGNDIRIMGYYGTETDIVIPDNIWGLSVVEIGRFYVDYASEKENRLISVETPQSVTHILPNAFRECQFTQIHIPNGVIGELAFFNGQLTTVRIGHGVTILRRGSFATNQISDLIIGNSVLEIGDNAFSYNQLEDIIIPNSVTYIGFQAFLDNQLKNVIIGNSVTHIAEYAFMGNQITSINIPNSVNKIGWNAFDDNQLTSVTISNSLIEIDFGVFNGNQLTHVNIPNSVTIIRSGAFQNNPITSVIIGSNVDVQYGGGFGGNFTEVYDKRGGHFTRPTPESLEWTRM